LGDSRRFDPRLPTNVLQLIEGQTTGLGRQRPIGRTARRGKIEDLAHLVVPVSTRRHGKSIVR